MACSLPMNNLQRNGKYDLCQGLIDYELTLCNEQSANTDSQSKRKFSQNDDDDWDLALHTRRMKIQQNEVSLYEHIGCLSDDSDAFQVVPDLDEPESSGMSFCDSEDFHVMAESPIQDSESICFTLSPTQGDNEFSEAIQNFSLSKCDERFEGEDGYFDDVIEKLELGRCFKCGEKAYLMKDCPSHGLTQTLLT
ncbi:hypothetical protein Bhyg_08627 [Pseudolycoriella hygida]|uniref:CCHC-type domain-containing protein n=1 Tax=Pseudolycoriella hygida TaxID=35572 RepID=A0A9Q0S4I2_9DIPT|nr:hypothetical protein Bhyg_08627 [Pseudolycoriella hygida]